MPTVRRVIAIGLDGLEPTIVESMMRAGGLPNLARLRAMGGYSRLATTTPAQTPVAWSTFATGVNPGGHGIFDFLRRDPATYLPDLSLSRYEQPNAFLPPRVVNLRGGTPLWQHLAERGIPATVLRCPGTYPPDEAAGTVLSGMGVPDLRGGLGTATLLTTDPDARAKEGEQLVRLVEDAGRYHGHLVGPRNPRKGLDVTVPITLRRDSAADTVRVESDGEPGILTLRPMEWSRWLRVRFSAGLLTRVAGMVRLLLLRTTPHLEVYVSPVNFDPRRPLYPIAHPPRYAAEVEDALGGAYYTTGMVEDHGGLANGRYAEETFLAQCNDVMRERAAMMRVGLDRLDEGFFFILFDTPDRVQHMFWRFREPAHPANRRDPQRSRELGHVIEDHYRDCDAVVGEAMRAVDDATLLLVLSDHGFSSFQRGVSLNNWLLEHGFLVLRGGASPRADSGDFLRDVDWGRTRAYALGLGSIYLNVTGRERDGIVPPGEADALASTLARALTGLVDDELGAVAVVRARTRAELYHGPFASASPDVVAEFNAGYRVSWETVLGGFGDAVLQDNIRPWAGDHIVSPALVPGVLFANRSLDMEAIAMLDMAPTILSALGVPVPSGMEGRSRWLEGTPH